MSTVKKRIARIIKSESGQGVLIAVLILLVIGGLMFPPLLGFMSTGLKTGQMHEEKAQEVYAADSGVELGMWKLQEGEMTLPATLPTYNLNNCDVVVTITSENATEAQQLAFDLSEGDSVYKIVSTAKFINSSSEDNTTIEAHVVGKSGPPQVDDDGSYDGTGDIGNNAIVNVTGNLTMAGNIGNNAVVYVGGTLTMAGNIRNNAVVYVGGTLTMAGNIRNNAKVCVGGDLTVSGNIGNNAEVYVTGNVTVTGNIGNTAKVYAGGGLTVGSNIENWAVVCVGGDLTVNDNIEKHSEVYVGGNITENGEPYTGGDSFEYCPCEGCPLSEEYMDLVAWESISP